MAYIHWELMLLGKVCVKNLVTEPKKLPPPLLCVLCTFQTLGFERVGLCYWFAYYVVCSFQRDVAEKKII